MSLLTQAILVALFVSIAFIDAHMTQTHIFRPLFVGPIVGAIMGDFQTGLAVGIAVELMFLAIIFVGTAVPPNPTISTAIAAAIAILGGGGTELAVATALPISFIGQMAETLQNSVINVFFMHRVEHAVERGSKKGIIMNNMVWPMAVNFVLYGIPTFLAIYFGASYVQKIIDAIPHQVMSGLAVGGNMIGAVGFALLLNSIKSKKFWPFLLLGFFFAAYLQINMIGIAVLAVIFVALYYYLKLADETKTAKPEASTASQNAAPKETKITKKDLWNVFWGQMTIRCANNYERQQNAGFTQAMIPVAERLYTDPADKKELYERHMEYFLTQDMVSAIPIGVAVAMEERYAIEGDIDPDSIDSVKTALMGPLAGLGDSLLNGTARPLLAGIGISLATAGLGWIGPIFFVLAMAFVSLGIRYVGVFQGYKQGTKLVQTIQSSGLISKISDVAAIAAYTIVGGFIPLLVVINTPFTYVVEGAEPFVIQNILDDLMPGMLGLLYTMFMYYMISKKKISAITLIWVTMLIGIVFAWFGILG